MSDLTDEELVAAEALYKSATRVIEWDSPDPDQEHRQAKAAAQGLVLCVVPRLIADLRGCRSEAKHLVESLARTNEGLNEMGRMVATERERAEVLIADLRACRAEVRMLEDKIGFNARDPLGQRVYALQTEVECMADALWAICDGAEASAQDRIIAAGGLGDRYDHSKPHGR